MDGMDGRIGFVDEVLYIMPSVIEEMWIMSARVMHEIDAKPPG